MKMQAYSGFIFCWFIFCCSLSALGQQSLLKGKITDSQTNLPVEGVSVVLEGSGTGTLSDKEGNFSLRSHADSAVTFLVFSHINYQPLRFRLMPGQTNYLISLLPQKHTLTEVSVSANKKLKPEKVKPETILDYAILNNRLLMLSWEEGHKYPALQTHDLATGKIMHTYSLPFYTEQLFVDCLRQVHLLTETSIYQLDLQPDSISLYAAAPRAEYDLYMQPCLTTVGKWVYFRQNQNKGITASFHAINQDQNEPKLLCTIQDEAILRMQQEEQRFQFFRSEMAKEAGNANAARLAGNAAQSTNFAQKVLFRAPYVPLVKLKQEVLVFDHVNGKLLVYHEDSLSRTVPISYHLKKHWSKQILVDEEQTNVYTTFTRNGITELKLLNHESGSLENSFRLPAPFAHKITVINDTVFFLCKDPARNNRQFLYRAPLYAAAE